MYNYNKELNKLDESVQKKSNTISTSVIKGKII